MILNYVMRRLGYGHQLVELPTKVQPRKYNFQTNAPNYHLINMINSGLVVDFDTHLPVNDFLPYTPLEYILGGIHNMLLDKPISGQLTTISATEKFSSKTLIDIPTHPMGALEFINVLQDSVRFINSLKTHNAYFILPHDDVVLNAVTSNNFTKTAMSLSIPTDVINALDTLIFCCDVLGSHYKGPFFSYTFIKTTNGWVMDSGTTTNFWVMGSPFEVFMYAWALMLRDIDHLCNRVPHQLFANVIDYNHHYNLRAKYDITSGLERVAQIIDSELAENGSEYIAVQTILKDNSINLSSSISDFRAAQLILQKEGSKRKIVL